MVLIARKNYILAVWLFLETSLVKPWSDVRVSVFENTTPQEYFPVDDEMLEMPKTTKSAATTKAPS